MNLNLPQLSTIRIQCNEDIGTAVIYFPDADTDYVYILTAKHCLVGEKFNKTYSKEGILLDQIFNDESLTYHSYVLSDTAVVITSVSNEEDLALIIVPANDIVALTGKRFFSQVIDADDTIPEYKVRGFANFNDQKDDQPFSLKFLENKKHNPNIFTLHHEGSLDTFYQQAMSNVAGLSGSGAYADLFGNLYFVGIIHTYVDGNTFIVTKVLAYNNLIDPNKFKLIEELKPETNPEILDSYGKMDKNREIINLRTRESVGSFTVHRDTSYLIRAIKENNLVVIHGKPGVGKSALAKAVVTKLKSEGDYTVITLTPENLYCNTLDEAMKSAGYNATIQQIVGSPLSARNVLIWIESFEKLIESEFSGAFNELLQIMKSNSRIILLITLREYLLQRFRIHFYFELPKNNTYLEVNDFTDGEIQLVQDAIPQLKTLLENPKIKHLLHNPYYLDKAVRIIPFLESEQQLDEIKFKKLMWQHIVENGNTARGAVFYEICVKRSREMCLFTDFPGSEDTISQLLRDNIILQNDIGINPEYSPSHDILEDWALIRFISEQKKLMPDSGTFLESMENNPAMKRAFRLWMEEFYLTEPVRSVSLVHELLQDSLLSQSWKDELLVVSLRSKNAAILLDALKDNLLNNEGRFLKQIMFLLQIGCKRIDPAKQSLDQLLPTGSGWDYIIDFIWDNYATISSFKIDTEYIALIEAWSKQLPDFNPQIIPPSSKSVANFLEGFVHRVQRAFSAAVRYDSVSSVLEPYVRIIFKLTAACPSLVENLIQAAKNPHVGNERWNNIQFLNQIRKCITEGVMADQICRFFPDDVLEMAREDWLNKEEEDRRPPYNPIHFRRSDARDFGLSRRFNTEHGFPSAYHTFFYWMFLYHPDKALDFIIIFLNAAFEKNQSVLKSQGEDIEDITVSFHDGTSKTYYGTYDYWSMYRSQRSENRHIASLLMALEAGLLDLSGKTTDRQLRGYLQRIIKESNNVAFLGITISVIQAHPELLDENSVCLLGIPIFFWWESSRWMSELYTNEVFNDDEYEKNERTKSNSKVHRRKYYQGLVGFVFDYMFIYRTQNDLLYKEIDKMWEQAPAEEFQWRKFLFDMDARKYQHIPVEYNGRKMVQIQPGYDEEVRKNVTETNDIGQAPTVSVLWAKEAYDNNPINDHNYEKWRVGYDYIQNSKGQFDFMTSKTLMASLGLRDFFNEMNAEQLIWCRKIIMDFAEKNLMGQESIDMYLDVFGKQAALTGLSYNINCGTDEKTILKIKELIFRLLIGGLDETERIALEHGIVHHLQKDDSEFVLNCWYGLLAFIEYKKETNSIEQRRRDAMWMYGEEAENESRDIVKEEEFVDHLTTVVLNGSIEKPAKLSFTLDMPTHWLLDDALRIIPWTTTVAEQHNMVQEVLKLHLEFLGDKKSWSKSDFFESRRAFTLFYPRFLLSQSVEISKPLFKELLDLTITEDKKLNTTDVTNYLYRLLKEFIRSVANGSPKDNFWTLWDVLREWTLENETTVYIPLFFMDLDWTAESENWHVLEGKSLYYKEFITKYGFNKINECIKFLSGVAFQQFMPESLSWVALMLKSQNAYEVNRKLLENFAEKAFYKYGNDIKTNKELLADYLFILDFLITIISPKAYMLKDELIQYK
ncbi:ATP-binding protein [Chryseobacterium sp. AG363]|uniref:ATP-binding protein n=1 Tax=Chryseobacterium sp. AG363 TaxID=2183997 RepID=UPI000E76F1E1|nr:ATP-binding protein [Chryseobacterium sp. AG363]RKE80775.1 ATPase family protein associated with various cellular activities (AAA) [Chryseobacterium sp. AG363]